MSPTTRRARSPASSPGQEQRVSYGSFDPPRANDTHKSHAPSSGARLVETPFPTNEMGVGSNATAPGLPSNRRETTGSLNHSSFRSTFIGNMSFATTGINQSAITPDTLLPVPGAARSVHASSTAWRATAPSSSGTRDPSSEVSDDESTLDAESSLPGSPYAHEPDGVAETLQKRRHQALAESPRKHSKGLDGEPQEQAQDLTDAGYDPQQGVTDAIKAEMGTLKTTKEKTAFLKRHLPYVSFKTIPIPARSNEHLDKPLDTPQRDDPTTWYAEASFEDSMILYWCDECELSYAYTSGLFTKAFRPYTYEIVRQHHIKVLLRQFSKYYKKAPADIPPAPKNIMARGDERAAPIPKPKKGTTTGEADANSSQTGTGGGMEDLPIYVREASFRQLEIAAIVVCKDLFKMEFPQIRDLMESAYDFPLNLEKTEEYYQSARPLVYGSKYHGHSSITDALNEEYQQDIKIVAAAAKALMAISQDDAGGVQQVNQQRSTVKVSHVGQGKVLVASAEREATGTLLQLRQQGGDFDELAEDAASTHEAPVEGHGMGVPGITAANIGEAIDDEDADVEDQMVIDSDQDSDHDSDHDSNPEDEDEET
ncbi:hypothetical protein BU23DRAFT_312062 [Bimuria novae-zelandiae CBS 107.79]|uniref:Uncharacterized protein n=1 Tax=Bimuria novae-zelandiae CBS 107.79 TaxID=1447943 RepID=A0A6A5UPC8_9PLEO|nr:hypothetical protein BU23DRAFT_312062 [Bimuria novae-zelandiae CBS 107.79]